ncbi:hypothetical protein B296_00035508 [Ensete ventricosum]|uniref:Uncharacterized protein n=1 Tax=Ensete ventricosum TaxID=4639 RepID=A0A427A5I8_ENSVE|nr:hypothetical protein B296_00035508 [Ensete ventricosum]
MYCLNRHVHTKRREKGCLNLRYAEQRVLKSKKCWRMGIVFFGPWLTKFMVTQKLMIWQDKCAWIIWCLTPGVFHLLLHSGLCPKISTDQHLLISSRNIDKDQVKAAIRAQQDQQIDNVSTVAYALADNYFFA